MVDLPSTPVDGNVGVKWVAAIADTAAPKIATEINAVSSLDISCYLTSWEPGGEQASIPDSRLCSTQDFEQPGKITRTLSVTYIENPDDEATNEAALTLVEGTAGYLVQRRGLPFDTAYAVGQVVDVWPVKCGIQVELTEGGQVLRKSQKMFVIGEKQSSVVTVT